jgi:hypothetical protein
MSEMKTYLQTMARDTDRSWVWARIAGVAYLLMCLTYVWVTR